MKRLLILSLLCIAAEGSFAAEVGESLAIEYQVTNVEVIDTNGVRSIIISCTGEVEGYGHARGTATLHGVAAGATGGPAVWRAMALSAAGIATDIAPGSWQRAGPHSFRFRNISNVSDGTALMGDSIIDLSAGTVTGAAKVLE